MSRQRKYWSCGHYSSVTHPYRNLGDIVLDPKKLTLSQFNNFNSQITEKEMQDSNLNKWKTATKIFPVVRMNTREVNYQRFF